MQIQKGYRVIFQTYDQSNPKEVLCAKYFSPPLRQMRSPLHTNFFAAICHPPF